MNANKRKAYFISQLERAADGGYIPCIAIEGESGYYKTDWNWGDNLELAESITQEKNAKLGISSNEAMRIQLSSMHNTDNSSKESGQAIILFLLAIVCIAFMLYLCYTAISMLSGSEGGLFEVLIGGLEEVIK